MTTIDIYQTWQNCLTLFNVQQGGQLPPWVFNNWYNEVSDMLFKKYAKKFATEQVLVDMLIPFTKRINIVAPPQPGGYYGVAPYPTDYEFFLNASVLYQKKENTCFFNKNYPIIDGDGKQKRYEDPDIQQLKIAYAGVNVLESAMLKVDLDKWQSCLNHPSKSPTLDSPKMMQGDKSGMWIAPKFVTAIVLYYLKTPVKAVFSYTVSAQDILIYDQAGSTQLEWSEQMMPEFLAELQKKYNIYVNDPNGYQMGDNDKKQLE